MFVGAKLLPDVFTFVYIRKRKYFSHKFKIIEVMKTNKRVAFYSYSKLNKFVTALTLVIAGIVILGHNLGTVSDYIFRIIISWQMLLIVLGITSLLKRNLLPGCILAGVGLYFLLPRIIGEGSSCLTNYWPVFLILLGLIILFHQHQNPWHRWRHRHRHSVHNLNGGPRKTEQIVDGFVNVDVAFGSSRHIVLDPVFRGADLNCSFGSIVLDLRRTSLEAPETYIDANCSFGGMELFVSPHWYLFSEMDNTFGSCEDKRYAAIEIDADHKLIIRGGIYFGGLEIKN
jgi:hypothetical protein